MRFSRILLPLVLVSAVSVVCAIQPIPADNVSIQAGSSPEFLPQVGHNAKLKALRPTADGKYLISTDGRSVKVWDAATGSLLRTHPTGYSWNVGLSPDGSTFAFSGPTQDAQSTLLLVDTLTGATRSRFPLGRILLPSQILISPDGSRIALGEIGKPVTLLDVKTGMVTPGPAGAVYQNQMAWSPDGELLLTETAGLRGRFGLWSVKTGKQVHALNPIVPPYVNAVGFSPDGRFAFCVKSTQIQVWETATGMLKYTIRPEKFNVTAAYSDLAFAADGSWFATSYGGGVLLYGLENGELRSRLPIPADHLVALGTTTLFGTSAQNAVQRWEIAEVQPRWQREPAHEQIQALDVTPDGRTLAIGTRSGGVYAWDLTRGTRTAAYQYAPRQVTSLRYRPDGQMVAVGFENGAVSLGPSLEALKPVRGATQGSATFRSTALAFSRTGGKLLFADHKEQAVLMDVTPVKPAQPLGVGVPPIAISPDGTRAALCAVDKMAFVDLRTRKTILSEVFPLGIHTVLFSPDGKTVVFHAMGALQFRDGATGAVLRKTSVPGTLAGEGCSAAYSPDGSLLALGGDDGVIYLTSAEGELRKTLAGHLSPVECVAFTPDGRRLLTAGSDQQMMVWDVASGRRLVTFHLLPGAAGKPAEWISLTEDGYYACSEGAEPLLTWRNGDKVTTGGSLGRKQPERVAQALAVN